MYFIWVVILSKAKNLLPPLLTVAEAVLCHLILRFAQDDIDNDYRAYRYAAAR
jgi:hypothetical protein